MKGPAELSGSQGQLRATIPRRFFFVAPPPTQDRYCFARLRDYLASADADRSLPACQVGNSSDMTVRYMLPRMLGFESDAEFSCEWMVQRSKSYLFFLFPFLVDLGRYFVQILLRIFIEKITTDTFAWEQCCLVFLNKIKLPRKKLQFLL